MSFSSRDGHVSLSATPSPKVNESPTARKGDKVLDMRLFALDRIPSSRMVAFVFQMLLVPENRGLGIHPNTS